MGDDCQHHLPPLAGESGEDHISGLPDELLHVILLHLNSLRDAARTSVLSRRWRPVWTYLPQLILSLKEEDKGPEEANSLLDTVDAVLAASAAPAIELLSICVPVVLTAQRIAPWLRYASERVTGEISLDLKKSGEEKAELELPACAKATSIQLNLSRSWKLRLAGALPVLTCLHISSADMDAREFSDLVSTRCPRLKELTLLVDFAADSGNDVSIHSDSMHSLELNIGNARWLEVIAPRLEDLSIYSWEGIDEICVSAPKLAGLILKIDYNPRCHLFTHVSSHLRLLDVPLESSIAQLMKQFHEVDELRLKIGIQLGIAGYKAFMNLTNQLPKCETLRISLCWSRHSLVSVILHLLRCCNSIKKLSINLTGNHCLLPLRFCCPWNCPCHLPKGCKTDDIDLLSLEEVQIVHFFGSHEEMEFVEKLSQCNAPVLKKLGIFGKKPGSLLTQKVREKVRCLCRPNLKVEFYRELYYNGAGGFSEGRVHLD